MQNKAERPALVGRDAGRKTKPKYFRPPQHNTSENNSKTKFDFELQRGPGAFPSVLVKGEHCE